MTNGERSFYLNILALEYRSDMKKRRYKGECISPAAERDAMMTAAKVAFYSLHDLRTTLSLLRNNCDSKFADTLEEALGGNK